MNINNRWLIKGFVDESIDKNIDIITEIEKLKKEKNAILMAHYYQEDEIQDIADYVGDSLALAQEAAKTNADIILLAGVHFMGETAKIISPDKKVLVPDLNAGCSLADSCPPDEFKKFVKAHPNHKVITYVNTSAEIKALSDIVVTSTNANAVVNSFSANEKIIFGPDRNLGNYLNSTLGRNMVLWDGACHVHEKFSVEKIVQLKIENPDAKVISHPECKKPLLLISDHVGSTASLLKFTNEDSSKKYIVATESGILHQMKLANPDKIYIPAPANDSTCACNECEFMRLNTIDKVYNTLKYEWPEIILEDNILKKALRPIEKMLELSNKIGL